MTIDTRDDRIKDAYPMEHYENHSRRLLVRRVEDIKTMPLEWLWQGRFPLGKTSLLVGDPGLGKSLITVYLAAAVSRGLPWPIEDEGSAPCGDVIMISAEDDAADTIRPRLEAAGADLTRVSILDGIEELDDYGRPQRRSWTLRDRPELEDLLKRTPECKLILIDPLSAYLGGADSHKNADVRALLAPISELAAEYRVSIIAISHLNKGQGAAIYRTSGSQAFVAAVRSAYLVAKDPCNDERRLMLPIKANLAADNDGLAYRVDSVNEEAMPHLAWEAEPIYMTADEALGRPDPQKTSALDQAKLWLADYLAHGPRAAGEIRFSANECGYSWATIKRAKKALAISAKKTAFGGSWEWHLPDSKGLITNEGAQKYDEPLGDVEHLGKL